jgi:ABC-type glycerol-3-phosphate transport system substrate-binding protein
VNLRRWCLILLPLAALASACGDEDTPAATQTPTTTASATPESTATPSSSRGSGSPQESIGVSERITITVTDPE